MTGSFEEIDRQPKTHLSTPEKHMFLRVLVEKNYRQGCCVPDGNQHFCERQEQPIPSRRLQKMKYTHRLSMNVLADKAFYIMWLCGCFS